MKTKKLLALGLRCLLLGGLLAPAASRAEPASLENLWKDRAETARKRLAGPGLDACDRALETAFLAPRVKKIGEAVDFGLRVEIDGQSLVVSYSFEGGKPSAFQIIALPRRWMARQQVGNKTLSVLVTPKMCAMDFCPDDPFASGPCPGEVLK